MIGETYYERGRPVIVRVAWRSRTPEVEHPILMNKLTLDFFRRKDPLPARSGPRNVVIEREDGSLVVRPFRGLRKTRKGDQAT
jgi:acetyl esterase